MGRSGPFWDGVEGRAPVPPAAATLGFEFVGADVEAGTIELALTAREAFTNPSGNVLGGFVAAMLYDTVGPALLATLEPDQWCDLRALGRSSFPSPSPVASTRAGPAVPWSSSEPPATRKEPRCAS
jgi:hypothetical protein